MVSSRTSSSYAPSSSCSCACRPARLRKPLRHGHADSVSKGASPSVLRMSPMYLSERLRRSSPAALLRFSPVDSSLYEMVPELPKHHAVVHCRACGLCRTYVAAVAVWICLGVFSSSYREPGNTEIP
jgi:hypothetical protein